MCILVAYYDTTHTCDYVTLLQRLLVEWRKLDHSIVIAAISQWRRRLSACVMAHGGHF